MLPYFWTWKWQRVPKRDALIAVTNENDGKSYFENGTGTEADARAKMLIYLLENKLITP